MRKILVDSDFHKNVEEFCNNLFSTKKNHPSKLLKELKTKTKGSTYRIKKEREYIDYIIQNYKKILKAKPSELDILITEFESIIRAKEIGSVFHKKIVTAMMYCELRESEILEFLQELDIKTCCYCNAHLTLVIDIAYYKKTWKKFKKGDVRTRLGRLELDHFYPKSLYPFLSTSFYNLLPCCSNCNRSKNDKKAKFYLYSETNNLDVFKFNLIDSSIDKYWSSRKFNDLQFEIVQVDGGTDLLENHKEIFKIEEIYNTQKDVLEELIHIKEAYTEMHKKDLKDTFISLFPDKAIIQRLIVGNYINPEEVHKRPLAKFTMDIAKDLKLI